MKDRNKQILSQLSSKFKFKPTILFINIFLLITLLGCVNQSSNENEGKNDDLKNNSYLTATVYNATVQTLENEYDLISLDKFDRDHEFSYDKIQVFHGFTFKVLLDFDLEPYFIHDYKGKEIEVVISYFGLYSEKYDLWYDQEMIIFKSETEIVGFLTGQMGVINELNPFKLELKDLHFTSAIFLTEDKVVKYYDKGDKLYNFKVDLSDLKNIKLDISYSLAFVTEEEDLPSTVVQNSLTEISGSEVLDIMELTLIERVDLEATIVEIDSINHILTVVSNVNSLQTVKYQMDAIYDLEDHKISPQDMSVGDTIKVYYYKRSSNYVPIDIRVDELIVKKIVEVKTDNL